MSKKYSLIINIAMIVIGIIGMLFYYMSSKKPQYKPSQVQKVVKQKLSKRLRKVLPSPLRRKICKKGRA